MPETAPICKLENVCLQLSQQQLISNISLALNTHKITVILGHNGAGKSLLLRMLHGLIRPSSGTIDWHGQPAHAQSSRIQQSMVLQSPVLLRRSVAANLDYVLQLHGQRDPGQQQRNALLAQADLLPQAKQPARSLSGGEQQRLCLIRALATRPSVLFLDEPCASLDPAATQKIEAIIKQAEHRVKILIVTHDLAQARRLANDVIFLNHGRLCEYTAASQFFSTPQSRTAHAYLDGVLTT